ncbi:MAG: hypothetical protein CML23_21890 [Rhizobiaceae bacterium]|nr:hypothetical protein [Rhizobiaceae bacterium]|tara:strand:- start:37 stop:267 length:231 start_codon:yes stop_codon:yes gene_type:complete
MEEIPLEQLWHSINAMGGTVRHDDIVGNARMALLYDVMRTLEAAGINDGKVDARAGGIRIICLKGTSIAVPEEEAA